MSIHSKFNNYDKNFIFQCKSLKECSGCHSFELNYQDQLNLKKQTFLSLLLSSLVITEESNIPFEALSAGPEGLRDRLDFSWQNGRLGLYRVDSREILDLPYCPQLSPRLQEFYSEFRKIRWPLEKASFRLRVSPKGEWGVWIDCANVDIKKLLDEESILKSLLSKAFIEIGQRRKVLTSTPEGLKLKDPQHLPWFSTWGGDQELALFCQVASFTQPSHQANRLITDLIQQWIKEIDQPRVIEFGSGIGNLTLPAAMFAKSLLACEIDQLALEGLEMSLQHLPSSVANLKEKIQIFRGDFQRKIQQSFKDFDLILANPPRSGLMNFLNPLADLSLNERPPYFLYMSCFPESMAVDLGRLKEFGYSLEKIALIDQFPQTQHFEVIGLLQREEF